eukprot:scaffold4488_cov101-Skeletonema_dohrnii-CCMP3373.AAC.1
MHRFICSTKSVPSDISGDRPTLFYDLTNPEYPTIADELKNISGYSSYLHPIPNGRLLAIGKEANETAGEGHRISYHSENGPQLQQRVTI